MKVKTLTYYLSAFIVVAVILFFTYSSQPVERLYESPSERAKVIQHGSQSIRGAIEFYSQIKANQHTGEISAADVQMAYMQAASMPRNKSNLGIQWESLGPDNVGGRTRAIVIDKDNNNVLYAGSVGGGFYKSTNKGNTWVRSPGQDDLDNVAIVSMIQTSDGTIYFGTGEQNFTRGSNGYGNSGVTGRGIWKSTDRGETFEHLPVTRSSAVHGTNNRWNNVNSMADDPTNPLRFYTGSDQGFMVTEDGGQSFTEVPLGSFTGGIISDIRVSPDGKNVFVVRHNNNMSACVVMRSTDFGKTFTQIGNNPNNGDVITSSLSRLVLAISPSNPDYVYASGALTGSNKLRAIWQSKDNGDSWEIIGNGSTSASVAPLFDPFSSSVTTSGQGDYDNIIAVCPKDPERVFVGGVTFYQWTPDLGWKMVAGLTRLFGTFRNPYYVHADNHTIIFDTKTDPYTMYIGNDGGLFRSTTMQNNRNTPTYDEINKGYITTQFYSVAGSVTGEAIGGTQDNGTILVDRSGMSRQSGYRIKGGDGAYVAISRYHPNIFFAESQYGALERSIDRGTRFSNMFDRNIDPDPENAPLSGDMNKAPFVTAFRLWEENDSTSMFFFGINNGIWMTRDATVFTGTPEWFKVTPNWFTGTGFSGHTASALAVSENGNVLYIGSRNGKLFRLSNIRNADISYKVDSLNNQIPFDWNTTGLVIEEIYSGSQYITNVRVDPNDSNRVAITLGNYGNSNFLLISTNALDAQPNWKAAQANLPRMPVYDAAFIPGKPNVMLLATEMGIYSTNTLSGDNVTQWLEDNNGMDRVATYMIDVVEVPGQPWRGPQIFIGTHGRGIFMAETFFTSNRNNNTPAVSNTRLNAFPNPAREVINLSITLEKSSDIQLHIFDINGRLIETMSYNNQQPGEKLFRINTSNYKNGTYLARVHGNGFAQTARFIVMD